MEKRIQDIKPDRKDVDDAKRMISVHGLDEGSLFYQKWRGRLPSLQTLMVDSRYQDYVQALEQGMGRFGKIVDYEKADLIYFDIASESLYGMAEFAKNVVCCTAYNEIINEKMQSGNFFRTTKLEEIVRTAQTGQFVSDKGINDEPDGVVSKSFTWNTKHPFVKESNVIAEFENLGDTGITPLILHPCPRVEPTIKGGIGIVPDALEQMEGRIELGKAVHMPRISSIRFGSRVRPDYWDVQTIKKAWPNVSLKLSEE